MKVKEDKDNARAMAPGSPPTPPHTPHSPPKQITVSVTGSVSQCSQNLSLASSPGHASKTKSSSLDQVLMQNPALAQLLQQNPSILSQNPQLAQLLQRNLQVQLSSILYHSTKREDSEDARVSFKCFQDP